jgi:hypothetical protein
MNPLFPDLEAVPVAESGSDVAYTPDAVAFQCVVYVVDRLLGGRRHGQHWCEPCAGDGAFARAMTSEVAGPAMVLELDPMAGAVQSGLAMQGDALAVDYSRIEVVITNPPFTCAAQLLRRLLDCPTMGTVCFLVLQGWIVAPGKAPEERLDLLWGPTARPVEQVVLYPRIAFQGPGRSGTDTDMREYCLLIWRRQADGSWLAPVTTLRRLDWRTGGVL